ALMYSSMGAERHTFGKTGKFTEHAASNNSKLCRVHELFCSRSSDPRDLHSFPTRRSSDLLPSSGSSAWSRSDWPSRRSSSSRGRSEEHTSELQSRENFVCRLLLEKKHYRKS